VGSCFGRGVNTWARVRVFFSVPGVRGLTGLGDESDGVPVQPSAELAVSASWVVASAGLGSGSIVAATSGRLAAMDRRSSSWSRRARPRQRTQLCACTEAGGVSTARIDARARA
jgi:hypothetical protein